MEQILISVIIPVFNAEKYLKQCIDSLLKQTYPYFELICVDDGSTDCSYELLKEYERLDNRIKVIKQNNQYAGVARNSGMKLAKGKYLLFLDADDFFEKNMLELLVACAEQDKTEILIYNVYQYDNISNRVINKAWNPLKMNLFGSGIKSAEDIADFIFEFITPAPWNKFFLREFIESNHLEFQNIKRTNDLYFVFMAVACAKRIGVLDKKLMYYRDNNVMSLQGSGEETPSVFAEALYALKDGLMSRGKWSEFQKSFGEMAIAVCLHNLNNMKRFSVYNELYEAVKRVILPGLGQGTGRISCELSRVIRDRKKIIIYGAGTLAKAFARFLLVQCMYEKKDIAIVVTSLENNIDEIWGIKVQSFNDLSDERKNDLVIVAVAVKNIQNEIKKTIFERGFEKNMILGFQDMANIIRNGIEMCDEE